MDRQELNHRIYRACFWLTKNECAHGGVAGDQGGLPYPEVSGYLIPAMLVFGLDAMAYRSADWLIDTQCLKCGGWPGWKENNCENGGECRAFDTSAVVEGLMYIRQKNNLITDRYYQAINTAIDCLLSMRITTDQSLQYIGVSKAGTSMQAYNLRSASILNGGYSAWAHRISNTRWAFNNPERIHYIAYALEGLKKIGLMDEHEKVLSQLRGLPRPFNWSYYSGPDGSILPTQTALCTVGNFQMAIQLNDVELFDWAARSQTSGGGFPSTLNGNSVTNGMEIDEISWPIKYFLEGATYFYGAGLK